MNTIKRFVDLIRGFMNIIKKHCFIPTGTGAVEVQNSANSTNDENNIVSMYYVRA
jgi:hypothetical protein